MKVHQIMTAHARGIAPDNTLVEAAGLMRELDVGALPVFNGDELTGMVTDRDMVLRAVADGRDPANTTVGHVMSQGVIFALADQEVEEVARVMQDKQVRRLPVLNGEKRLVGIVSIGDVAISSHPVFSGMALREVSQPPGPNARQRRLARDSDVAARRGAGKPAKSNRAQRESGVSAARRVGPGKRPTGRSGATAASTPAAKSKSRIVRKDRNAARAR